MLKYNDIISKLTSEQKIRILTGVGNISGKDMRILGIPTLSAARIKSCMRDVYPHSTSLSHAWNSELWERVAGAKLSAMTADGVNLAIMPGARIKLSPYRKEVSEDPYLASSLSGAYLRAAKNAGVMASAAGYYLTESDTEWMDDQPNERILNEYIAAPYLRAAEIGGSSAIMTDVRELSEKYGETCTYMWGAADSGFFICENATDEHTVDLISRGVVCLKASTNALSIAYTRYKKLKSMLEAGKDVTTTQLEEELADRTAISEESLDRALDRALELVFMCAQRSEELSETEAELDDDLPLRSVLESGVLLKNQNEALPLSRKQKICIVGGIAFVEGQDGCLADNIKEQLNTLGYQKVSTYKGYDVNDYSIIEQETLDACKKSDAVILFVGMGLDTERRIHRSEKMTLPPNQLLFADKLAALGKRVVAVMLSEHAPDVGFAEPFDGLLLMPTEVRSSALATVMILTGLYNPSGRLAYSLYSGTEKIMKKAKAYICRYGMSVGPFIGYRYYDTAEIDTGYPFGHGLSYTEFQYSKISVKDNTVSFTVKNTGKLAGVETSQIYIGHKSSACLRPKKELCGFVKTELAAGESKQISVTFEVPKVWNGGEFVTEKGEYTVYVGSSVTDIRLKSKYVTEGVTLENDGARLSDYLQSCSNITEGNFTLEANYSIMKKTVKNILVGVGSLAIAIGLAVFNITTGHMSLFLGIIAGILAVVSIIFFIIEAVERSIAHKDDRKKINEANKEYFKDAEQVPVLSTEKMFKDEFDVVKRDTGVEEEAFGDILDFDASEYIDDNFRIKDVAAEFSKFAEERGFKLTRGVAENLFASFTTSRLLVFSGLSSEDFRNVIRLLAEYFETTPYIDNAMRPEDAEEDIGDNVFFSFDSQWDRKSKNILTALQSASNVGHKVQLAAIEDMTAENVTEWLEPFMRYVRHPKKRNEIRIYDGHGKNYGYNIARNLWLVVNLAEGERLESFPSAVLKCAAAVRISYVQCEYAEEQTPCHGLTSEQVDYMLVKESSKKEVPEDMWKKVDRLERYASEHSDYSIGNKLWRDLEKQMGMLLACDLELIDAADAAIAVKLLPSVCAELNGKLSKEDKTVLQTMEFIFGEENIQYSKAMLDLIASRGNTAKN